MTQLQARGYIENATIPDLGPIPQSSPVSVHSDSREGSSDESDGDSDSDSEDEQDEAAAQDDDEDEYAEKAVKSDSVTRKTRPRTRRTGTTGSGSAEDKKEQSVRPSEDTATRDVPKKRKRGRPPKIDTPEEARIRAILRTIRKVKDADGRQLFLEFEKLPDEEQYPDYYKEIKRPIALDDITVSFPSLETGVDELRKT